MSYSIKLSECKNIRSKIYHIQRNDGIWKDSPHFASVKDLTAYLDVIKDFEVFDDDVWLVGYFKTGTTVAKELIWLLMNNLNFEHAKSHNLSDRFPYFEKFTVHGHHFLENIISLNRPRLMKTHLPASLLPDQMWTVKPKMIHMSRNPLDVAVSFHHWQNVTNFKTFEIQTMEKSMDNFIENNCDYAPYIEHNMMFWEMENRGFDNILFLTYEDIINDMDSVIERTQKFLGKNYSDEQVNLLKDHLSFSNMKKNDAVNHSEKARLEVGDKTAFVRKGKIGSYKEELSPEYLQKMNEWLTTSLQNKNHRFNLLS